MSRLFCIVDSDARSREERITVHERADIEVRWGSTRRSKQLVRVLVDWKRGEEKPTIFITTDEGVDVKWNTEESREHNMRGSRSW